MKIYFMRHGQTDWNVKKRIQGTTDIELNSEGIKQAEQAREKLKDIQIDIILSSPLKRAKKTAEIVNKDRKLKIIYDDKLKERCFGIYEGHVITNAEIFESEVLFDTNKNIERDNIEPINTLYKRIENKLDEIKEKYKGKNVLVVTHGGVLRVVNAYFKGIPEDGVIVSANIKNCEIFEYEY